MQEEQQATNAAADFDLDAYLDGVQPTHRTVTVNTRGDLLKKYGGMRDERDAIVRELQVIYDAIPDEPKREGPDLSETLSGKSLSPAEESDVRKRVAALTQRHQELSEQMANVTAEYAQHKVRVTFRPTDKSTKARITSAGEKKSRAQNVDDTGARLMHASIESIVVVTPAGEVEQDLKAWTLTKWMKFLDRIGDGQAVLLVDGYMGLANGTIDAPFSLGSSSGATGSTS